MALPGLHPFRSLDNPREVWAWGMFDFANQSFTLLIITLLFSLYVQQVATPHPEVSPEARAQIELVHAGQLAPTPELQALIEQLDTADRAGAFNWSLMHGGSLLLVVALSPMVGALADAKHWRKAILMGTGFVCAALTAGLALVGSGAVWLAALIYVPANLCYQIGENFLASFLPRVAPPRSIGRISAIGWTMGYAGALGLLVCVLVAMVVFDLKDIHRWPLLFVFAGVWFAAGIIPAGLWLPRDTAAQPTTAARRWGLLATLRRAGQHRQLARFLLAFFVYGFGVQVIIGFTSIIARGFGFGQTQLVVLVAQITIVAGCAAMLTGRFQDRIGAKATVGLYLGVWIVSCAGLVGIKLLWPSGGPAWPIWVVGNGLGLGLGGIGTASRSMVARFTPRDRTAEFFGLWGFAYKLAGAVGVLAFGTVTRVLGDLASLVLLLGFFAAGFVLILRVDELAGVREARRSERASAS